MTIPSASQPVVQAKINWSDPWFTETRLEAVSASLAVAPSMSQAVFRYSFGSIATFGAAGFHAYIREHFSDRFVRICRLPTEAEAAAEADFEYTPIWRGFVTSDSLVAGGASPTDTGDQTFNARGLEYFLARTPIDRSYVSAVGGRIDQVLPFNLVDPQRGLQGNRSSARADGAYYFSDDGDLWTAADIVEYLLVRFAPGGLSWSAAGATADLANITPSIDPRGTVFDVLSQAIDRRRGFAWSVSPGCADPTIRVDSIRTDAVNVGAHSYAANSEPIALDGDAAAVTDVRVIKSSDHRVDRIEVRGGPLIHCLSTTLADGWTAAAAAAYKNAAKSAPGYAGWTDSRKKQANDDYRADDRFADVYRLFAATQHPPPSRCRADGSVEWGADGVSPPLAGQSFLRRLPIQTGVDYSTATPSPTATGTFLAPAAFAAGHVNGLSRLYRLDASRGDGGPGYDLQMIRGRLAVRISGGPLGHVLAHGNWTDAEPSFLTPQIEGGAAEFLVAVASPEHLSVRRELESEVAGVTPLRIVIEVPSAEAWYLAPGTIVGLDASGAPVRAAGGELRNDRDLLRAVAALAESWYSRKRRAVEVRWNAMIHDYRPGSLLTRINYHGEPHESNSIVSSIAYDFEDLTTTLLTDYVELDFPAAAGAAARGASIRRPRLTAPAASRRIVADGESLDDADPPVRIGAPAVDPPASGFWAILGEPVSEGDNQWRYPFAEAEPQLATYGGWIAKSGGITGTARNTIEEINTGAGGHTEGNGVDPANLDPAATGADTFEIMPITGGNPVWVRKIGDGYWFEGYNGVDGDCGT